VIEAKRSRIARTAGPIGLAALLLCLLGATPAAAAPTLQVELNRDEAVVGSTDERLDYTATVQNTGPDPTAGLLSLEVELPAGQLTYAHRAQGSGWSCEKLPPAPPHPARALCTRADALGAGASYPSVEVVAALGADVPDPALARASASGGGAAPAADSDQFSFTPNPFGVTFFETGVFHEDGVTRFTQAGGHPHVGKAKFVFATKRTLNPIDDSQKARLPVEYVKQVFTDLPRGLVGNALAVPALCPIATGAIFCPPSSYVGGLDFQLATHLGNPPIVAREPEFGTPAQFTFREVFTGNEFTLTARLRPEDNYAISLDLAPSPRVELLESEAIVCAYGAKVITGSQFVDCKKAGEPDPDGAGPQSGANPKPLFTNPTRCEGVPPTVRVRLNSWENPDRLVEIASEDPLPTGCEKVPFEPAMELSPTTTQADSPSGLEVSLTMPTAGLEGRDALGNPDPGAISQANLKRARITFPEGMAVNASAGHGLGSCSPQQAGFAERGGRLVPDNEPQRCPDSSKIGTVEIETPLIGETLTGSTYIAEQGAVEGALIGLYLIFESKKDGIIVKLPAKLELDPRSGRLTTVVDQSPEAPFSAVRMHFPGGSDATLLTPPRCGAYEIKAELSSWAAGDPDNPTPGEIVTDHSSFDVTEGPGGGPCPRGALEPKLEAGATNPLAGAHSPFTMRLHREDGSQRFSGLSLKPPPGLVADLRGIPYCPDAALASIDAAPGSGQGEIDAPSCPPASLIGTAKAGAGGGPNPFYVDTGRAYLAGPYRGAPLSLALVTPAVAGPLDLGSVLVRSALHVDPKTARISAISDPIPTILHGLLLDVRDIRVAIDRPGFTINPTSCEPLAVEASVRGEAGALAGLAERFQLGGCRALGFKPRISLRLKGGARRGDNPALTAVVRPRPGDANIDRAAVTLPRSAFLDQGHIRTVCTRVQFAADACPRGAIYGRAEAATPLLDEPLRGPVYLRSSDNQLPDLVADLRGPAHQPIKVEASFRTDSIRGGIRSTIDAAPDAPVSRFVLRMQGGKKGLVVNSRNLCARGANRANARLVAQNGRRFNSRPKVVATNCAKRKRPARKSRAGR
jgi:hypothetical protein